MIIDKLSFCNVANFSFKRIIFIAILIVLTQRPIKLCNYTQASFPMELSFKFCIMKQKFYDNDLAKGVIGVSGDGGAGYWADL